MSSNNSLESLFKELDNFIVNSQYDQAISICEKILKISPSDKDAFHCKLNALIHLGKNVEALKFLESDSNLASSFIFEKAYCLYREKKYSEGLDLLRNIPEPKPLKILQLETQIYYRLDDFENCHKIFSKIIQQYGMPNIETKTNLFALYVSGNYLDEAQKSLTSYKESINESFEFAYNVSCYFLQKGDYSSCEKYLQLAFKLCEDSLKIEGASQESIDDELAIIKTQQAYLLQIQGKSEEAINLYNSILKNKPSDESVSAVASNNIVVLNQQHDLFDSFKKLKQATSQKLSSTQKKIIGFNRCLVLLHMSKLEQCRELLQSLQEQFPDSDRLALVSASLLLKEKKSSKAEELLENFATKYPNNCERVQLTLAQLYINKGNLKSAIDLLQKIPALQNKPALVATLISLYEQMNDITGSIKILDQYASSLEKRDEDEYIKLLKHIAKYRLQNKQYKEAASILEKVIKVNPNDLEALPQLVIAYSHFDPKVAEKYESKLPRLAIEEEVNAEALENLSAPKLSSKQKPTEVVTSNEAVKPEKEEKKKKKKRKKRLPKNFDPNKPIDPERWLPLRERSYFKRKGRKNKLEKSSQGAAPRPNLGKTEEVQPTKQSTLTKPSPSNTKQQPATKQSGSASQTQTSNNSTTPASTKTNASNNQKKKNQKKRN